MAKCTTRTLKLSDSGKSVKASIESSDGLAFEYEAPIKSVSVRVPRPSQDTLLSNSAYFAERQLGGETQRECLEFYIRCREKDISKEIDEIRKSVLRIQRNMECIEIARKTLPLTR